MKKYFKVMFSLMMIMLLTVVTVVAQDVANVVVEPHSFIDALKENWTIVLVGLMAFLKIIVNLTPSEKDNKIFSWLDNLINLIIPNLKSGGGTHKKE